MATMLSSNSNSNELDDNVQNGINKMKKRFKEVEILLNDLMGGELQTAVDQSKGMSAVDKAKYFAALAYCIQNLYHIYLRLKNEETRIDSSNAEIQRVKDTILKIKNAINVDLNADSHHSNGNGPRMRLDKAAAKRFIAHNLDKDVRDKMRDKFGQEMRKK